MGNDPWLVVGDNWLFVIVHLYWRSFDRGTWMSNEFNSPFDGYDDYGGGLHEMYNIVILENVIRVVVQLICSQLWRRFEDGIRSNYDIVPCFQL